VSSSATVLMPRCAVGPLSRQHRSVATRPSLGVCLIDQRGVLSPYAVFDMPTIGCGVEF
jgi:hypothetical protein